MMSISATNLIQVLIIDNHALVRTSLRAFLEGQPGLKVVGDVDNALDALAIAAQQKPDVILFEPNARDSQYLELIPRLLTTSNNVKVLLVTGIDDPVMHSRAVRLGAMGIVLKEQAADILVKAIRRVYADEVWLTRSMMASVLTELTPQPTSQDPNPEAGKIATLSQREREIIALLGQGLKNNQIAERLSISEITVRHYIASILEKICLSDRLDLLIYAYRYGLAQLPR
jgi:DNA-binding NarL/FixJ family response regulator